MLSARALASEIQGHRGLQAPKPTGNSLDVLNDVCRVFTDFLRVLEGFLRSFREFSKVVLCESFIEVSSLGFRRDLGFLGVKRDLLAPPPKVWVFFFGVFLCCFDF